jgi:hypothetical protein
LWKLLPEAGFKTFTSLLNTEIARTARTSNNVGNVIAEVEGQPEGSLVDIARELVL